MKFENLKEWTTPRGNVVELAINGRIVWKNVMGIGSLPVGSSVFMNVGGVRTEFLIVQQGNPDSAMYDESCDGTWLLMKNIYAEKAFDSTNNDYENSDIHAYLNGNFLNLFDTNILYAIKQIKIPYHKGVGSSGSVAQGYDGLSAKIFHLSTREVNLNLGNAPVDGTCLSYFVGADATKRVAYLNGTTEKWALRSPRIGVTNRSWVIDKVGSADDYAYYNSSYGVRPALIMPSDLQLDDNFNIVAPPAPDVTINIDVNLNGDKSYYTIRIGDTQYDEDTTLVLPYGTVIYCEARDGSLDDDYENRHVYLNGKNVTNDFGYYKYVAKTNATIKVKFTWYTDGYLPDIYITEE